ncbi:MAG: hypothetical protein BWX84_02456 [Verrucomicrobia bacterium ADurb.Bin118]|nr:MAG: hypothetical protein BWX84_02456 [Verrucomicrobia bacterium ADurb.Bin118]
MPPLPGLGIRFGEGVHHLLHWRHQALSWARLFLLVESARGQAQSKSWRMDPARGRTRSVVECGSPLPLSGIALDGIGERTCSGACLAVNSFVLKGHNPNSRG